MQTLDFTKIKKVFFIGIAGIGISALAKMAVSMGMEVSGVNDENTPKTLDPLRELGVEIFFQDDLKDKLPIADLYVFSDAWTHRGPYILSIAHGSGKPTLSYFEALGHFAKAYKVIAVAGTHGKTTTTAMVAEVLVDAGFDPTVVVGSFVKKFGSNFRKGSSEYLVVEADEYNRHFLNFHPFITVITNIEADHMDYYKDLADIETAFKQLILQTQSVVIYNDKEEISSLLIEGTVNGDHKIKAIDYNQYLKKVPKLSVPGVHNRMNAAAALAVADVLSVSKEGGDKSIAEFSGTWRRLEKLGETAKGTIVYDDYAHHPTEIRASLQALRELYPSNTITVVFQPHLYSRTKVLFNDFAKSFRDADRVILLPIYFAREDKDESISSEKLATAICADFLGEAKQKSVNAFPDFESAQNLLKSLEFGAKDVFVTMGAGEAYKVTEHIFKVA